MTTPTTTTANITRIPDDYRQLPPIIEAHLRKAEASIVATDNHQANNHLSAAMMLHEEYMDGVLMEVTRLDELARKVAVGVGR